MTDNADAPHARSRLRQILQDLARLERDRALSEAAALTDRSPLPTSVKGHGAAGEASAPGSIALSTVLKAGGESNG